MIKSKTQLQTDIAGNADFTTAQKTILTDAVDSYQNIFAHVNTTQRNLLTPTTGLTVFNTDNARFEYWNGGQWLPVGQNISGVVTEKIEITSAQLLDLGSTPVTLIPAPAPGYAALVLTAFARLNFVTTEYDFPDNTICFISYSNKEVYAQRFGEISSAFADAGTTRTTFCENYSTGNINQLIESDAIVLFAPEGGPTTGDSTLSIWITYTIIPY